jgi:glycosyltransferase involved in cell wall biosynthesis
MKVLIFNDVTSGGGAELYVNILAKKLREEFNIDVVKVARVGRDDTSITFKDYERIRLSSYAGIRYFNDFLRKVVEKTNPDLIHANFVQQVYMNTITSIAKKHKIKLVVTVHDYGPICPTSMFVKQPKMTPCDTPYPKDECIKCIISTNHFRSGGSIKSSAMYQIVKCLVTMQLWRSFLNAGDIVIVPSMLLYNKLRKIVKGPKLYHLWNPVPEEMLNMPVKPLRDIVGSKIVRRKVAFIGRLVYVKGVGLIPHIATKLLKDGVLVEVVGSGPLSKYIREASKQTPNLVYRGYISDNEKVRLIEESSALIMPSVWCEGFGMVVSEALARGRPVIAFNIGGPKELIECSNGGVLAKPFDVSDFAKKTSALVSSIENSNRLGLNGRRWVEDNLDPKKYVREYLRIVEG